MNDELVEWTLAGVFLAVLIAFKWAGILKFACVYAALSLADG